MSNNTKKLDATFTLVIIGIVALFLLEVYRLTHLN